LPDGQQQSHTFSLLTVATEKKDWRNYPLSYYS